ncbi:hypothetical protein B0T24DRAFT_620339 [Lasiosphaeria ovina]|uniref:C2H2-type domain-containing protein n=1 Tax=Lasiosphaeria ovina TaxID=92902 RepID=A0AAE0NBB7_9PEZI|nr:hypothetical protein B0T24DRAFT_620339 [Lasiosphaeria ovina]
MEETIKPMRGSRSSNRNSGIFQDLRQQAEALAHTHTPQRANTMPMAFAGHGLRTPDFMNMSNLNDEFIKIENAFDGLPRVQLDLSQELQPGNHDAFSNKPDLQPFPDLDSQDTVMPHPHGAYSPSHHGASSSPSRRGSPHRRTDSLASIASAASIASINIDETKTDTGVTGDDIALYIEGPDAGDGKWVCVYEGCLKRFGRKENIKSHVQTHLNDRQYQCPTCNKCFVRQHDLKRHAKIHTGIKPYPCECGNSFARHDALTRHRQRGMCIGAFDGVVRKVVKRGRPRKLRPGLDERLEKSERTRRKNNAAPASSNSKHHASTSSISSQSGYSDSSAANSPAAHHADLDHDFDGLMDDDAFPDMDMMDVAMADLPTAATSITTASPTLDPSSLGLAGIVSTAPMPSAPATSTSDDVDDDILASVLRSASSAEAYVASPSAMSSYSHTSHASAAPHARNSTSDADYYDLPSMYTHPTTIAPTTTTTTTATATNPASPAKSVASHYTHLPGTPPGLSASSSSPPPPTRDPSSSATTTTTRDAFFDDADADASGISDTSIGLGTTAAAHAADDDEDGDSSLLLQFADDIDHPQSHPQLSHSHLQMQMQMSLQMQMLQHHSLGAGAGVGAGGMLLGSGAANTGAGAGAGVVGSGSGAKFVNDDDYDAAVSMFTNVDDVFFGSS